MIAATRYLRAKVMDAAAEIERAPKTFKSNVWNYFGFEKGNKSKVICLKCKASLKYSGNTTNMAQHIKRHHPSTQASSSTVVPAASASTKQTTIETTFTAKFHKQSVKGKQLSEAVGEFLVDCMLPFSVVDNPKFRKLVGMLEPRYSVPDRKYFTEDLIPKMYEQTKAVILAGLNQSVRIAVTTDGWTSRATQSYITITAHYIDSEWEMRNIVLQTRLLEESHTGENIARVLIDASKEWGFKIEETALVSDNASNMTLAASKCGCAVHIRCLAHTLNLASQKALSVSQVSRLLGRIRKTVSFFHRSTTASACLKTNQTRLELPVHKLINDVSTRWNSSMEMLERFLEPAIMATVMSKEIRNLEQSVTVGEEDVRTAEDIVTVLKPVKIATTVLCSEKSPTASLIYPLYHRLLASMTPNDRDKGLIRDLKASFQVDLSKRYSDQMSYLSMMSALDPRFKSLPFSSDEERESVYSNIAVEAVTRSKEVKVKSEPEQGAGDADPVLPNLPEPPLPKIQKVDVTPGSSTAPSDLDCAVAETSVDVKVGACALDLLFTDAFITKVEPAKPVLTRVNEELVRYRAEPLLPLKIH